MSNWKDMLGSSNIGNPDMVDESKMEASATDAAYRLGAENTATEIKDVIIEAARTRSQKKAVAILADSHLGIKSKILAAMFLGTKMEDLM